MITLPGVAIQRKIYESSASLVYQGIREEDGRSIVIKLLKQDYPSPQELTRYRQEYSITRSLSLEGVIKAYSQQDYQRTLVILLEDFGGESLEHWIRERSNFCPISLSAFLKLAIDITDILGRVHAANVIHKDINPGNIVLNLDTGVVKIIDFGIATRFNRTNPTFKSPHMLEGTLAYLSPEQTGRMNRSIDYRTDFYSLGVTFYELLTGQLPFPTTDILELIHCHIAKSPTPPHELNGTIPKSISDIILKLMAKNAEDRYQSAWGIKADLEQCADRFAASSQIGYIQLGLQDVSDQFQIPQKLYGREAEIAILLAAFERVAGNRESGIEKNLRLSTPDSRLLTPHSEMMLVSGYSGVGKSALVQELYKPITAKHGYFISGKFDQFQRNIPYSAIVDALRKLMQQLLGEPDEQVQQWRSRLLTVLGSNGQLIIDVIPEVELIVGKQQPVPEVASTEAQNRFNLVFQQFIRVFCSKEHPLVIFLDDLQWIDSATLKLIELMLLDEQTQFLFLIGAYRDNEVSPTHPLVLMLDSLRKQGAVLHQIVLSPLSLEPLGRLVAEALHQDIHTVLPLAEFVLRKTGGNPFFVGEFLHLLYSENLLRFDADCLRWRWNLDQIRALTITDNVVELLLNKLKKLPEETQQLLQLAACIGAEFDLETLAIVCEQSPKAVFRNLLAAIQAGLIQPLSELDENLLVQEYKFSHDRVQQAAYALIDESQKQVVHLQIGCNLLNKTLPKQLPERLFEIVDHLNYGIELVADQQERDEIAKLNLLSGQKAKAAIAYSTAKIYLAMGRAWLADSSWQTNYELTLELYAETTEVAYLCGDFEAVEQWAGAVLKDAKTVLDTVKVYEVKIQSNIAQLQPLKAINTALQVLQQMGVTFPETPTQSDIGFELGTIISLLSKILIQDLIHLPQMTEPDKLAAMRILSSVSSAAFIAAPNLVPLLAFKQVSLSIQYGNTFVSHHAYAMYGLILCGMLGDIESGYQFGQVALRLLSQPNTYSLKGRTLIAVNSFIIHWKEPARKTLEPLLEAYRIGLETGDLEFAASGAYAYCCQSFAVGKELTEVERDMMTYCEVSRQLKQEATLTWYPIIQQTIANLMGYSVNPTRLIGEFYDEEKGVLQHEAANDGVAFFSVYFNRLFLCYLFSEYTRAIENSALASTYLLRVIGSVGEPSYYLYDSLARLATYSENSLQAQSEILQRVAISQEKIKRAADHAPMNYLHKYHLLEAEKAQVLNQLLEAEEFYEQAIQGAKDNKYLQEEALAYELAAKFYLERGREKIAQLYMKEAHYCYDRWGATAKVKDLETRYPQFFPQSSNVIYTPIRTTAGTTSNTPQIALDLATVLKASEAIAREIELEQLLSTLMQILIENAGAQTGCLLLENSGEWAIEAACELNDSEQICVTRVLRSIPIAGHLPETIIHYVIRTHESVILNNAAREGNFINDPNIQQNQTQSLLCLPLLNQSKLVGVLYLENQLVTGAFTPERTQLLSLLSTQAAIAIENAKLYSKFRTSESQMAQFLEAIPLGVTVVDTTGCPYYLNQRAMQLTGKESAPSTTLDQLTETYQIYVAGTDQKYPTEKLTLFRALRGERARSDDSEIHRDGTIIPIEIWSTPVFDEQGNVAYAISAFQDITERKQAEKLLADYNRTLEQQVAERTLLLSQEIEERQRVENALRQSEANYRNLVQTANTIILCIDTQERIRYMNSYGLEFFGYEKHQILGRTLLETIVPETETSGRDLKPFVHNLFDEPESHLQSYRHVENENQCRDGRRVWVAWSNQAILNEQGELVEFLAVGHDITQRRQAEEALQRSEAKFRNIFENSQVGIFRTRLSDGLILDANQRFADLLGFDSPEEVIGLEHSTDYYANPNDRQQAIESLNRDGELQNFEVQLRKQDGTLFWGIYSTRLNVVDGCTEGVIADITDRKQAEVALQASEAELRALFSAIPDLLCVLTAEGRVVEIVEGNLSQLYSSIEQKVGNTLHQIFEAEQADEFLDYIQQVLKTQQVLTVEYSLQIAGRETWFSTRIAPIQHEQVIWLARDITLQKQAEAASILEERNRMAREIHDTLAQSFTGIVIHARSAASKITVDPEKAQAYLAEVQNLARTGLTEARRSVEALRRPYLLETHDLLSAFKQLIAQLKSSTGTPLICEAFGTPYRLPSEVENNLLRIGQEALTNALKYAEATEIRVELIYQSTKCILQIKDDGQGFSMAHPSNHKGFGLLGMTERADRIGAQLQIESIPGRGTKIVVSVSQERSS